VHSLAYKSATQLQNRRKYAKPIYEPVYLWTCHKKQRTWNIRAASLTPNYTLKLPIIHLISFLTFHNELCTQWSLLTELNQKKVCNMPYGNWCVSPQSWQDQEGYEECAAQQWRPQWDGEWPQSHHGPRQCRGEDNTTCRSAAGEAPREGHPEEETRPQYGQL